MLSPTAWPDLCKTNIAWTVTMLEPPPSHWTPNANYLLNFDADSASLDLASWLHS